MIQGNEKYIHHVHISEPGLKPIEKRKLHLKLSNMLGDMHYNGFVSIEAAKQESIDEVVSMMKYVKEVFG